mmetsp:Transcript_20503/g.44841  ORF Transcript_20503/g.44841 Transcript_20503/m.44841 type:complete len:329 (-) Transcript_20503:174-1160(-)
MRKAASASSVSSSSAVNDRASSASRPRTWPRSDCSREVASSPAVLRRVICASSSRTFICASMSGALTFSSIFLRSSSVRSESVGAALSCASSEAICARRLCSWAWKSAANALASLSCASSCSIAALGSACMRASSSGDTDRASSASMLRTWLRSSLRSFSAASLAAASCFSSSCTAGSNPPACCWARATFSSPSMSAIFRCSATCSAEVASIISAMASSAARSGSAISASSCASCAAPGLAASAASSSATLPRREVSSDLRVTTSMSFACSCAWMACTRSSEDIIVFSFSSYSAILERSAPCRDCMEAACAVISAVMVVRLSEAVSRL